ncbi:MAG: hypothetical protein ACRCTY_00295, partial [Candidatus Adiutrix sp.]
ETVVGQVGGDLSIISVQNTNTEAYQQKSQGFGASINAGGDGGNLTASRQSASGNYADVLTPSGIFAGSGGFDLTVGGHTSLVGAIIDSQSSPENNSLSTASLSVQDIENYSEYSAKTSGGSIEISGTLGSIAPTLPQRDQGAEFSQSKSAVAPGTVTITDEAAQKAKTGQTIDEAITALNRDTANAHGGPLSTLPDLQGLLNKQAEINDAAGKAGAAVAQTVGDISEKMYELTGDKSWLEGGLKKTLLQAAGAGLVAELGNGSGLDAALGAAASQLLAEAAADFAKTIVGAGDNPTNTEKLFQELITNLASTAIGAAAGGTTGAVAASTMDRYNRQLHPIEIEWIEKNAEDFVELLIF